MPLKSKRKPELSGSGLWLVDQADVSQISRLTEPYDLTGGSRFRRCRDAIKLQKSQSLSGTHWGTTPAVLSGGSELRSAVSPRVKAGLHIRTTTEVTLTVTGSEEF
ncbi:unnamed protein product [Lota lota]